MKSAYFLLIATVLVSSCNSTDEPEKSKSKETDSVQVDEAEMPVIEEMEMEYFYEVKYKSGKVVIMSQEEYLKSGVWEDPEVIVKEMPAVK